MNSNPTTLSVDEQIDEILNINLFDVDCKVYKMLDINETKKKVLSLIRQVCLEVIGQENEYSRDMPVPNPFASPQDYVNLMKQYQLAKLNKILEKGTL